VRGLGSVAIACAIAGCGRLGFGEQGRGSGTLGDGAGVDVPIDRYANAVLGDGAIAYWRLDESSGTTVHDALGHYPGTLIGGCTLGAAGALTSSDTAVALDGTSCRIEIGTGILGFTGATPFSIELWANATVTSGSVRWLVSNSTPSGSKSGYAVSMLDNTLWFEQDDANTSLAYTATTLPALGAFHHVVVTTNANRQRIYVDGAQVVETAFTATEPSAPAADLSFGDYQLPDPNKFEGTLDEIAFYDRELDAATIASHVAAR